MTLRMVADLCYLYLDAEDDKLDIEYKDRLEHKIWRILDQAVTERLNGNYVIRQASQIAAQATEIKDLKEQLAKAILYSEEQSMHIKKQNATIANHERTIELQAVRQQEADFQIATQSAQIKDQSRNYLMQVEQVSVATAKQLQSTEQIQRLNYEITCLRDKLEDKSYTDNINNIEQIRNQAQQECEIKITKLL